MLKPFQTNMAEYKIDGVLAYLQNVNQLQIYKYQRGG